MTYRSAQATEPAIFRTVAELRRHAHDEIASRVKLRDARSLDLILTCILAGGHILLNDVPGMGKTSLVKALAELLGLSHKRIQFTIDLLPGDITGVSVFNQASRNFEFRPGPIFAQLVLADEINRATPRTQSAMLEAMAETQVTVDGTTYPLQTPFLVLATQNPVELEGTSPLPEAQLDRFFMQLSLGRPSAAQQMEMLREWTPRPQPLAPVLSSAALTTLQQQLPMQVRVENAILDYMVRLGEATTKKAALGLSMRGLIALRLASQAWAALGAHDGRARDYVTPDDVRDVWPYVVGHRLADNPNEHAPLSGEQIAADVLDRTDAPRL